MVFLWLFKRLPEITHSCASTVWPGQRAQFRGLSWLHGQPGHRRPGEEMLGESSMDILVIWLVVTGTWLLFSHILGMSSSQLTFIFFRGVQTTNQILSFERLIMNMCSQPRPGKNKDLSCGQNQNRDGLRMDNPMKIDDLEDFGGGLWKNEQTSNCI